MSAAHVEAARAAAGGASSPMARAWNAMDEREREFWLRGVGAPSHYAAAVWQRLGGDVREKIKVILPKVARRAAQIVGAAE